jgi:hypothetical protein
MGHFTYDHTGKKTPSPPPPPPPPLAMEVELFEFLTGEETSDPGNEDQEGARMGRGYFQKEAFGGRVFQTPGKVDPELDSSCTNKIFGIGYPKTGTSSLAESLVHLGYDTFHHYGQPIWERSLVNDLSNLRSLEFDAYLNVFPKAFYLYDSTFPNSKFILTTRESQSWLKSFTRQNRGLDKQIDNRDETFRAFLSRRGADLDAASIYTIIEAIESFGSIRSHESFIYKLEQHTREVEYYFRDRPDDLLVLPLDSPNKSVLLSNFLSKEWPAGIKYPHRRGKKNPYQG